MFATLAQLLSWKGPDAKAVVWAPNAHAGDARFTDMGWLRGDISLGQLCRERFGDAAQLIGFGTNAGTIGAAEIGNGRTKTVAIPPARIDSYEHAVHDSGITRLLIDLREGVDNGLRTALDSPRLERFIGSASAYDVADRDCYARASLARQFDAYVWFDTSQAVTPLPEPPRVELSHPIPI
jgi:erythromycin esterase-like protein